MYVTHRTLNKKEQPQRQCCRSNAWLCYVRGSRISLFPHWWVPKAESDTYLLRGGLSRHLSWCNLMMMNKERGQQTQVWEAGGWEPHVSSWPMNHQEGGKLEIYKSVKQANQKSRLLSKISLSLLVGNSFIGGLFSWLSAKESTCQAGDMGLIPGWENLQEKEMTTHSSVPA